MNANIISYPKHFLNQVIFRMDFIDFIPSASVFSADLEKAILESFPRRGKDQIVRFNAVNVLINKNDPQPQTSSQSVEGIQREYLDSTGKNKLIVSNMFMVFEFNQYTSFENLSNCILTVFRAHNLKCRTSTSRIGLRYINIFDSSKIKLQKNFFAPDIASCLITKDLNTTADTKLTRSMHLSEYRVGNLTLNFRYGMFNPEYPSELQKNSFALDYDCFLSEPITSSDDVIHALNNAHQAIQKLFEESITDNLRAVMNGE